MIFGVTLESIMSLLFLGTPGEQQLRTLSLSGRAVLVTSTILQLTAKASELWSSTSQDQAHHQTEALMLQRWHGAWAGARELTAQRQSSTPQPSVPCPFPRSLSPEGCTQGGACELHHPVPSDELYLATAQVTPARKCKLPHCPKLTIFTKRSCRFLEP